MVKVRAGETPNGCTPNYPDFIQSMGSAFGAAADPQYVGLPIRCDDLKIDNICSLANEAFDEFLHEAGPCSSPSHALVRARSCVRLLGARSPTYASLSTLGVIICPAS